MAALAEIIADSQATWTQLWHHNNNETPDQSLLALIQKEHQRNFKLWHQEDKARAPMATAANIATVKRTIDRLNQERNDLIEKVDEQFLTILHRHHVSQKINSPWNSETPGSVIDRLSILSLKIFHMREQTERPDATPTHIRKCQDRLVLLQQQRADLSVALRQLLKDLFSGRKQMKLYRQCKMYNDPTTNPEIYNGRKSRLRKPFVINSPCVDRLQ
ncbi:MAG: DUF4254 domain-containing protein [Planctomycetota bacterium]